MSINKQQQGFTLVELMVVIVIIGILAAIAIPQFANYSARAKVSSISVYQGRVRTDVADYYAAEGTLPSTAAHINIPSSVTHDYIDSITVSGGGASALEITYKAKEAKIGAGMKAAANSIIYKATADSNNNIGWTCTGGTMDSKFRPGICRS